MLYLALESEIRMDDIMSDDNIRTAADRRRRVQLLKKCIVISLVTVILLPTILCIVLQARLLSLDGKLDELTEKVEGLTDVVSRQQEQIDELTREAMVTGSGSAQAGDAGRELPEQEVIVSQETDDEGAYGTETVQPEEPEPEITAAHKVYLTFDDGPSVYTDDILDILDRYNVKATFFVVGKDTDSAREAMQEIVDRGHTLGMHSYSHKYNDIYSSVEDFAQDFTKIRDYIYEVTGVESTVYRFPGGSSNTISDIDMHDFADYLDTQDVRFFDWNISSGDGGKELLTVEALVESSTEDIEKFETSVILMHDAASKSTTVEALPIIIENILALEDTVILPITDETELVQHIH